MSIKKGNVSQSIEILNEMIDNNIELTHYSLSSILHTCLNGNDTHLYTKIWNIFVMDHAINPDIGCYNLLIKTAVNVKILTISRNLVMN